MTPPSRLEVDIISDVMCPWCYIGKRRLEQAVSLLQDIAVSIHWRPFQLDGSIPPEGMPRQEYLERKFGRDGARDIYARIEAVGEAEGIPFAFHLIEKSPNTLNAHRLIRWSARSDHQDAMVERLFQLFFVEGEDIGDTEVLTQAAESVGMDSDLVGEMLSSDADSDIVGKEIALAHEMGVEGVPAYIISNRYIVMGAQSPELLAEAFARACGENGDASAD